MLFLAAAALALAPVASADHVDPEAGCAVTPGGWGGQPTKGDNPGTLLDEHFDDVFGDQLVVGDLVFEDAEDVEEALPYKGNGGAFMSHAVALEINLGFGNAGYLNGTLGGVTVTSDNATLDGKTASEILAMAEQILIDDNDIRNSEYSDLVEAMTGLNEEKFGCNEAPPCPANVMAVPKAEGSILVTWDEVAEATEYRVYRSVGDDESFIKVATVTSESYNDTSTAVGQTYYYKVTAFDGFIESEDCEAVIATAIPLFPTLAVGAVALAGSVGGYAMLRRRAEK